MRHLWILLPFLLLSCETKEKNADETTTPDGNTLTETQKSEGWKLLFNGTDLDGWRTFHGQENDSWEVVDGTLHCRPFDDAQKRADLITEDTYDNFELAFEWKIAPQGNSGVMFRVSEEFEQPYFSGPEYQILDDDGYPGDPVGEDQRTGGNYDMHAPPEGREPRPVGEWNSSRLVVDGDHVEHWLNGARLFEYDLHSPEWLERKSNSKWNDVAGYGMSPAGHIALQDHSMEVWFRNVMIKAR